MGKWRSPLAILRWLFSSERLEDVPGASSLAATQAPPREGFLRWLLSPEELPDLDPLTEESRPMGLLRFIFSSERLPETTDAGTTNRSGGHDA